MAADICVNHQFNRWGFPIVLCCLLLFFPIIPADASSRSAYPLRPFYPSVKTLSTEKLLQLYFDAVIIDVRDRFAFNVIHLSKAKHVPLSKNNFIERLGRYRSLKSTTPLILYGNDPASADPFRAALLACSAGFTNLFVYDQGVFSLLKTAPEKSTLMAVTPAQPDLVIPSNFASSVRVDFTIFKQQASTINALILDIRNITSRVFIPRLKGIQNIPLESFLKAVSNRIWFEKKLLIFDQNGEQVNWLQYFLQANGYSNYLFLDGGVAGLDRLSQTQEIARTDSKIIVDQHYLDKLIKDDTLLSLDVLVMNMVTGLIRFENHAMVSSDNISMTLHCTDEQLKEAIVRLQRSRYLLSGNNGNELVFHINPHLAWKGDMSGELWRNRVQDFDTATSSCMALQ